MPKGTNQKLKLYYLSRIMTEKTDDEHVITMPEIQRELERYGVTADRKSLYDDLEVLRVLGIDVIGEKDGRSYVYHVGKKQFEIAELKLLVDAIQSSKFITEKKSNDLIKKLTSLASNYEASQLKRQVVVQGRIKTMNESIYYNVDLIHTAISENVKVRFRYFMWNENKKQVYRRDGAFYSVSPWGLTWDDENYYLIGYDDEYESIRYYRVDKMLHIEAQEEARDGEEQFDQFDIGSYSRKMFGMFGGDPVEVKLLCDNEMAGVMIDRFGTGVIMVPVDAKQFYVLVDVVVSEQFLGWVVSLGGAVRIVEPESAVEAMKDTVKRLNKQYMEG